MEATIYLITFDGQSESVYKWVCYSYSQALSLLEELEEQYPDRKWRISEKDVS